MGLYYSEDRKPAPAMNYKVPAVLIAVGSAIALMGAGARHKLKKLMPELKKRREDLADIGAEFLEATSRNADAQKIFQNGPEVMADLASRTDKALRAEGIFKQNVADIEDLKSKIMALKQDAERLPTESYSRARSMIKDLSDQVHAKQNDMADSAINLKAARGHLDDLQGTMARKPDYMGHVNKTKTDMINTLNEFKRKGSELQELSDVGEYTYDRARFSGLVGGGMLASGTILGSRMYSEEQNNKNYKLAEDTTINQAMRIILAGVGTTIAAGGAIYAYLKGRKIKGLEKVLKDGAARYKGLDDQVVKTRNMWKSEQWKAEKLNNSRVKANDAFDSAKNTMRNLSDTTPSMEQGVAHKNLGTASDNAVAARKAIKSHADGDLSSSRKNYIDATDEHLPAFTDRDRTEELLEKARGGMGYPAAAIVGGAGIAGSGGFFPDTYEEIEKKKNKMRVDQLFSQPLNLTNASVRPMVRRRVRF